MRDAALAAVAARLERIHQSGSPLAASTLGARRDAIRLARILRYDDPNDLQAWRMLGILHLYRYTELSSVLKAEDLEAAVRAFTPCFIFGLEVPESLLRRLADVSFNPVAEMSKRAASSADETLSAACVQAWRRILAVTPADDPSRPVSLGNLGAALQTLFEQSGNLADLEQGIVATRQAVQATPAANPNRAMFRSNLGSGLRTRFEQTGNLSDLRMAITVGRQAVEETPTGHPDRPNYLSNLGVALRTSFEHTGDVADLRESVTVGRSAVQALSDGAPNRATILLNFGLALQTLAERDGDLDELGSAITTIRLAVQATPPEHPDPLCLSNLSGALKARFDRTGNLADLHEAVTAGRQGLDAVIDGHVNQAMFRSNLGCALRVRFEQAGDLADLREAIALGRQAVEETPAGHPDRALYLSNLGYAVRVLFDQTGGLADLDEAIAVGRQAVQTAPADHPRRTKYLSDVAGSLVTRFQHTGRIDDLDEAIAMGRRSVERTAATATDRAMYLSSFSAILGIRFERTGNLADLEEAITHARQAAQEAPAGDPDRYLYFSNLGLALQTRYEQTGNLTDLEAAITAIRQAVQATAARHANRASCLSNLGAALQTRFERTGRLTDLEEAIGTARQAVQATAPSHPDWAQRMSNLGLALEARFSYSGDLADLTEAIAATRHAVQATSSDHPNRASYLGNLSILLGNRAVLARDVANLDDAIAIGRQAVEITPDDHPDRVPRMSNLATALATRCVRTTDNADLDEAVAIGRQVIQATSSGHPSRVTFLSNLGWFLFARFGASGAAADLNEAVTVSRQAADMTPPDQPESARRLSNLGDALRTRFRSSQSPDDRAEAITAYSRAAEVTSAAPSMRFRPAVAAASLAMESSPEQAADLFDTAVRLLPQIAPRQLSRPDQQRALGEVDGLTSDAAACVLSLRAPDSAARALGLLELGRAVLHSQALDARTDLTDLRTHHPDLANRFVQLRDELEPYHGPELQAVDTGPTAGRRDSHSAALEFTALIKQIRSLPGFEIFLLPPEPEQLTQHADLGPIVVLNVSAYRSDAIVLTPAGITAITLPDLTIDALAAQTEGFELALRTLADQSTSANARVDAQEQLSLVLEWLWDTVAGPVLEHLDFRRPAEPGNWPRMWWVPCGQLSLLPLHAAGYRRRSGDRTVMDRVISSYTPTIRALAYARSRSTTVPPATSLIVGMPTTPGIPGGDLPGVKAEVAMLRACLPQPTVLIEDPAAAGPGNPTHATVVAHLADAGIAHFACHAASNANDPSRSLLILHDHREAPLTVTDLARIRLDQAQLAYLSACRTSHNASPDLLDEAIHLTSAFQLAGYPHVVGTLWEINDRIATQVADAFYTRLRTSPRGLDTSSAAQALHHAIRGLQNSRGLKANPAIWAAFLHAGA